MKNLRGAAVAGSMFLLACLTLAAQEERRLSFVKDGKATGAIVVPAEASGSVVEAVDQFVDVVGQSTGVRLPVFASKEEVPEALAENLLVVGPSAYFTQQQIDRDSIGEETYRIGSEDNSIYVIGSDAWDVDPSTALRPLSRPTLWALNRLLEENIGVRWLWPGELGTHIPAREELSLPVAEITYQPQLLIRSLRMYLHPRLHLASTDAAVDARIKKEGRQWSENHLSGRRGNIVFGHAFADWWARFGKTRPDLFAELPEGLKQPYTNTRMAKLRLSNPAVIDQIVKEYEAAGRPKYWNVSPNDGRGFDISEGTRAWDIPANQSISDIVGARANLSARYVKFWNLLYERLRELNPDVVMVSYAYSAYRNPPPPERPLTANMILGIVHSYNAYAPWKGWAENGASLFLRPNWWHHGADAPYLPLEEVSRYVKFAWENNMIGIDMDSVIGYWATQGINYYMVARLMTRPDLSLEQIIDEYVEGFGDGADKIKAYINYWQGVTSEYNYDGGSNIHGDYEAKKSRYKELVAEGRLSRSTLNGSKYALPLLYGDEVIAPAEELLDEAEAAIGQSNPLALQRVAFLRSGLDSLRATRDQIALGQQLLKDPDAQTYRAFAEGAEALDVLRDAWAADNVMWGQSILQHENRYKVLIRPENIKNHNINLDGL